MADLTAAQRATLKAYILADPVLSPVASGPNTNYDTIANALSATAAPDWYVWRTSVQTSEIGGVVNYVAIAAMTTANLDRLNNFLNLNPIQFDPSRSDIRQFFTDTFSGALGGQGQATRDAMEANYRRKAKLAEKVLSTGTGSFATPAALGWEGSISISDVNLILNG